LGGDFVSILTVLELLPLVGALIIGFAPKENSKLVKQIALGTSLLVAVVSILMAFKFDKKLAGFQFVESRPWVSLFNINYAVGVDGMALVLIVMSAVLVPIVFLAGWNESENGRFSVKTFYILMLILETMMIGVFAATDVILFYVIFEAMLIPVYFLIGGYGRGDRAAAAMKFLLYSLFGGLLMLAAVIGLYFQSLVQIGGSFDITKLSQLQISSGTQNWLFLGFFIAFAIKAPLWPFHTWLPTAARSSSAGVATLLLGVLDKVGTYGMVRFCMTLFPEATRTFTPWIIALAVISILYGAFLAIGQRDINSLISYTSISHFGFITLGIFALTSQGLSGASFYMVNHGFSTAALFLVAGWMIQRRKSTQIEDYGGLQRVTPVMAWMFFIAGMSALALPGLSSFISEFLVLIGSFAKYPVAAILGTTGIILAALYVLIVVQKALHGEVKSGNENISDLNLREKIAIAPIVAVMVFLGFYPKPVLDIVNTSSASVMQHAQVADPAAKAGK
jgi:NADH-quinone oxidoreductase subunit M